MKIILGSKSPRRKELLSMLGYEFEVRVSEALEDVNSNTFSEMILKIANKKVEAIKINDDELLICADTVVIYNNKVLGKPKNKDDARQMIKALSNNKHLVYTGVVCKYNNKHIEFLETTEVEFVKIQDEEIEEYINTNEPYDKAGGYAIQGTFAKFVKSINGDFYNVMGLPICKLNQVIKEIIK